MTSKSKKPSSDFSNHLHKKTNKKNLKKKTKLSKQLDIANNVFDKKSFRSKNFQNNKNKRLNIKTKTTLKNTDLGLGLNKFETLDEILKELGI